MKSTPTSKWQIIKSFLKQNKLTFIFTLISGLLANVFTILIPVSLGKYFDLLFGFHSHRAAFLNRLPFTFWDTVPHYLKFLISLIFLKMIFQYLQRFYTSYLGELFTKGLREDLFYQQLMIKTSVYDQKGTGKYLLRHSGDLKSIQNYLTKGLIRFLIDTALLVISLGFLFSLNEIIFLVVILALATTIGIIYLLNKILFAVSVKRRNTRSALLSFVSRQLRATKTIKAFNKAPTEIRKYKKRSQKLFLRGVAFQKIFHTIFVLNATLLYLILVAVLTTIYWLKEQGRSFHSAEILGFVLLFITILPIFRRVIRVRTIWELGNISFEKLLRVFHLPIEKKENNLVEYKFKNGNIEVKNLGFNYENSIIFENLNFKIEGKKVNQIKLGNGQGKSTLTKLFAGLYTPQKGKILLDGQDAKKLTLKSIRKKVTFVSDEFTFLGSSVFEVIAYARNENRKARAQIILDKFQENIPDKSKLQLSDKIIEGGINLSKSQKKMLQYARVALSNKPIIVIDEPIRNLEKNTKQNILNWLYQNKNKKTIIFLCKSWNDKTITIQNTINIPSK